MKKSINIRNLIIVMLSITIICMGIGFTLLATKLDNERKTQDEFAVSITKVEALTGAKGGYLDPITEKQVINNGQTVDFKFTLNSPKDEIAYNITIKNTGTLPVEIIKLLTTPDYINNKTTAATIDPVTITHEQIENKILKPNKEITIKLVVTYNMSNEPKQIIVPYQMTLLATGAN